MDKIIRTVIFIILLFNLSNCQYPFQYNGRPIIDRRPIAATEYANNNAQPTKNHNVQQTISPDCSYFNICDSRQQEQLKYQEQQLYKQQQQQQQQLEQQLQLQQQQEQLNQQRKQQINFFSTQQSNIRSTQQSVVPLQQPISTRNDANTKQPLQSQPTRTMPEPTYPSYEQEQGAETYINPITIFSLKLLQNIPTNPSRNLIVSPLCAQFLLSMLEKGAGGETRRQLLNRLGSKTDKELHRILNMNTVGLKTALGIFYDHRIIINENYWHKTKNLSAYVHGLDFRSPKSKEAINDWVLKSTSGKINKLISDNYDLSSVNLVLLSAIYFENSWKYKFHIIGPDQFLAADGKQTTPTFMEIIQNIPLYPIKFNDISCTVIILPYDNDKYSMVLIVPEHYINLDSVLQRITPNQLNEILSTTNEKFPRYTKLQMPKFKLKSKQSLVRPLQKMDIVDVFSSQSDLTGISTTNLYVSDILQQASLDVDENGTVAAAATSALLIPLSADSKPIPKKFVINKPFISIIVDVQNKTPIFISKINNPE